MKVKLRGLDSLKLTEKCVDAFEFISAVKSNNPTALEKHISHCPACRKVALDAIKALSSSGIPDKEASVSGKKVSADDSGIEYSINIAVGIGKNGIDFFEGGEFKRINKNSGVRLVIENSPYQSKIEIEAEDAVFVLRMIPGKKTDAVVVLKNVAGEIIEAPKRFESTVSWIGVKTGSYHLIVCGKEGQMSIRIKLFKRIA